ncbi:MAG: hypothetical protein AB8H79_19950, partial [Myxococcota bacterium]
LAAALLGSACNAPPEGGAIGIGPDAPTTLSELVLTVTEDAIDPNDHSITYDVSWTRDGEDVPDVAGSMTVAPDLTAKGQVWEATAIPIDEKDEPGAALTTEVTIANSPPTATVTIEPSAPDSGASLTATALGQDADGDGTNLSYAWFNGDFETQFTTDTVMGGWTTRGDVWTVRVTPNDGEADGVIAEASVNIANSPPVALSVSITPTDPRTDTPLVAVPEGADGDADVLLWTFDWSVNGTELPGVDGDTLSAEAFVKGDSVAVTATPNDTFVDGDPVSSTAVVILNTPPVVESATIEPGVLQTDSVASCVMSGWTDADGDAEAYIFTWTVNGTVVGTDAQLDGAFFGKGDSVVCSAIPDDGQAQGGSVSSAAVTVANTAPTLTSASLSPSSPKEADTVSITTTGAVDIDGDAISFTYNWLVDGTAIGVTTAELTGADFNRDQTLQVEVTPTDGTDAGPTVTSAIVTASNTAPVMTAVSVTPSAAYTTTPLTATASATDDDGDSLSYDYAWYLQEDGSGSFTKLTPTTATLPASNFFRDDVLYVQVYADDGDTTSPPFTSSTTTVLNTAPTTPTAATISPSSPDTTDDLVCTVTGASDADGDGLLYEYEWFQDGSSFSSATTTSATNSLSSSDTDAGETWRCDVSVSDGTTSGGVRTGTAVTVTGSAGTFTFTDTTGDDVTTTSLSTFFTGLGTVPSTSYIFFEVDAGSSTTNDGAWCSERADWYVSEYLAAGTSSVIKSSGTWDKWSRGMGGSWSTATTATHTNYFGSSCASAGRDWCSEWGIGSKYLGVFPARTGAGETYARSFSTGGWKLTIKVGATRSDACGF